jgi:protein-tyrosine phosphatase
MLRALLPDDGEDGNVSSAGFLYAGEPATPDAVAVMAARGVDIADHRSRVMSRELIEDADLIVAMTGQHVAEVAVMAPSAWRRAFTLRDLVRRIEERGPRRPGESPAQWVARLDAGRTPSDVLAAPASDDIADPIGQPASFYEATASELSDLLTQLAAAVKASG